MPHQQNPVQSNSDINSGQNDDNSSNNEDNNQHIIKHS